MPMNLYLSKGRGVVCANQTKEVVCEGRWFAYEKKGYAYQKGGGGVLCLSKGRWWLMSIKTKELAVGNGEEGEGYAYQE